ncbi:O-antigen ligase family protein [Dictyobacter vulcani]|uniref:O-antigen ligase family protein n=1 Tax=Dictyobacter vulcani TaxID=2607529 RepID=UPI00138755EC|nr:O-antigen ligase family protein [Dictyobacter vulcani]
MDSKKYTFKYFSRYMLLVLAVALFTMSIGMLIITTPAMLSDLSMLLGSKVFSPLFWKLISSVALMVLIVLVRQYELAATLVAVISLILDWYLGFYIIAPILALVLLFILFLDQSPNRPFVAPHNLWLWGSFLVISIFPAIQGAQTLYDTLTYYPNLILGAFMLFWLGTLVGKDNKSLRRLFNLFLIFGAFIALHSIFEYTTGKAIFIKPSAQLFLNSTSFYPLGNSGILRFGSFFLQPDASSAFLAMMLFIPLGLFVESCLFFQKVIYLIEATLIAIALLFTYSTGAWLSAGVGVAVFFILVGSMSFRLQLTLSIVVVIGVLFVGFPLQITMLLQHASLPSEIILRQALWQTALQVIQAFPLTGVGLGRQIYMEKEENFRVISQIYPYNNPHNSYLELGAMGGLPVIFLFLMLLISTLWQAIENWKLADNKTRPLICGGIAAIISLSFNSWSFGVWTLAPLAVPGWLLLGAISSPLIAKRQNCSIIKHTNA